MGSRSTKGLNPTFYIVGEASKITTITVDTLFSNTSHPVVKFLDYSVSPGKSLLVNTVINDSGGNTWYNTKNILPESVFITKKNKTPLFHIKADYETGVLNRYLTLNPGITKTLHNEVEVFTRDIYLYAYELEPVFLFCDYDEDVFPDNDVPKFIAEAPGPVYVSTRKRDLSLYEGATAIIISENDFKYSKSSVSNLIVTLGEDGASFNDQIYPTEKQLLGDNFGCRERFFAMFAQAHYYTKDFDFAINIANKAALEAAKMRGFPSYDQELADKDNLKALRKEILSYSLK